jgi:N-acetylglucosamine kinase-like BadF-type ATPase
MILIADSGGTKTDWLLIHSSGLRKGEVIATFHTQGITPIHQTPDVIRHILGQELMSQLSTFPRAQLIDSGVLEKPLMSDLQVFFYGSGCTPAHLPMMKQMLGEVFDPQKVEVHSDLMAAARALCQREEGIACILGTGANSCLYDGCDIVRHTPALGWILGDEGSGAVLGRLLVGDVLKRQLPEAVCAAFFNCFHLTQADLIERVYRQSQPNRFLASLVPFLSEHVEDASVRQLLVCEFRRFLVRNVSAYGRPDLAISFVGGVASHFRGPLQEAVEAEGFRLGRIEPEPVRGMALFHR